MLSFVQEQFIPMDEVMTSDPSLQYKAKKADCDGRIQDNKSTHFQFGSDSERNCTEQVGSLLLLKYSFWCFVTYGDNDNDHSCTDNDDDDDDNMQLHVFVIFSYD